MNRFAFVGGVMSLIMICFLWLLMSLENLDLFLNFSLIFIAFLTFFQIKKGGILAPSTIVFVTALPYLLTAIYNSYIYKNYSFFLEKTNASLILYSFIFFGSFIFFDSNLSRVKTFELNFTKKFSSNIIFLIYTILVFIYIVIVSISFSLDIGAVSRADIYKTKSTFFDVYKLFVYSFSIFYVWFIIFIDQKNGKYLSFWLLPLILFSATDILILGDRKLAVLLFIICAYIINVKRRINPIYISYGFLFALVMWIYGYLRNSSISQWGRILSELDYSTAFSPDKSEFGAFSIIWNDYFSKYSSVQMHPTYLEVFTQLIPTSIFPNRPISPSVNFVKEFYPDIYNSGGGLAFNAILESMMNFNILGPIVFAFLLVFFSKFYNKSSFGVLLGTIYIFCFSFTLRNDMISNLRTFFIVSFVVFVSILIFCRVRKLRAGGN
ncbi:O-antigen polymerase [Acinetobacter sp. BHS4]|uniref:O-antigen polymerase n=1 Tax=Acinetobacter sp. BHS4 TaxID=2836181 RepID=UPI001BCE96F7|nr:O-antigen polymerase [Acinetobacter sp. BHS4]QVR67944.1 oligosaccharide repeat unit polymerase [Acinetobacter sp. BHS4]